MIQRFPFSAEYWTGSTVQTVKLRAGKHFQFDLEAVNHFCLRDLPSRLVDLMRIASSIYVVDRLVKRRAAVGPSKPSRTIGLKVHVLDAPFWSRSAIRHAIGEAIDFVSGDFWEFEFIQDPADYRGAKRLLADPPATEPPLVSLYSGGLDSAAGLAYRIAENPHRAIIPVSVWHQARQRDILQKQYALLRSHSHSRIEPLIVKVAMIWSSNLAKQQRQQERSQRCRSFLFASLGAIAGIMHGQNSVELFESGVGAINLPLMAGMIGWKTTKSSHPEFLKLMSRLASLVGESDFEFRLPFLHQTKGEVVRKLADLGLPEIANLTASCVGYPLRHSEAKQCGLCPACLFRREAMQVAGIAEPNNSYKYDVFKAPPASEPIPPARLKYLKAFLMQVAQLKDVERNDRLPRAFERHVLSTGIVERGQSQKGLIQLLARYRDEWISTAATARGNGHAWASWLTPQQAQPLQEQGVTYGSA